MVARPTPESRPCRLRSTSPNAVNTKFGSALVGPHTPGGCVSMALVSRSPRDSPPEGSSASLARWGGAAVCLGALSYGASGYLDKPDASGFVVGIVLPVLEALAAASFLGGVLGLYYGLGGG